MNRVQLLVYLLMLTISLACTSPTQTLENKVNTNYPDSISVGNSDPENRPIPTDSSTTGHSHLPTAGESSPLYPSPNIPDPTLTPTTKGNSELIFWTRSGLVKGNLAYSIPDSMQVGEFSRASVLVTMQANASQSEMILQAAELASISGSLEDSNNVVLESVQVGERMKAKISDPYKPTEKNFNITPLGDSIQSLLLSQDSSAFWQWDITPLKDGFHPLNLQLSVILPDGKRSVPVLTRYILVKNKPNWLPILGGVGLGIALLGGSILFYRNRRSSHGIRRREYLNKEDAERIRGYIAEADLELALEELGNCIQRPSSHIKNRLSMQSQEFTEIKELRQDGEVGFEVYDQKTNRIFNTLLGMITDLEKNAPRAPDGSEGG